MIPVSSRVFRDGWFYRGFSRSLFDPVVGNVPEAIFGIKPKTNLRETSKNLFKADFVQRLARQFKRPKTAYTGRAFFKKNIHSAVDIAKQVATERQEYAAIPAGLYIGHKISQYANRPKIKDKSFFNNVINRLTHEIHGYAQKAADTPILASLAVAGSLYGVSKLSESLANPCRCHQEK